MDQGIKVCPRCTETKPIVEFHIRKNGRHQGYCKPCAKQITNEWRRTKYDPDKKRNSDLKHNYGITLDDYERMYTAQAGCCAICGEGQGSGKRHLCVDHCHITGQVRGLLCDHCNRLLGHAKDLTSTLERAIEYLRRTEAEG